MLISKTLNTGSLLSFQRKWTEIEPSITSKSLLKNPISLTGLDQLDMKNIILPNILNVPSVTQEPSLESSYVVEIC